MLVSNLIYYTMKNDISNNLTVDLDTLFESSTEHNTTNEEIVSDYSHVDFARILNEVCYKLPKGYPTVVDGVLTEREEIVIINEALEAEGLPTLPLPEAKVSNFDIEKFVLKSKGLLANANISAIVKNPTDPRMYTLYIPGIKADDRRDIVGSVVSALQKELKGKALVAVKPNKASRMILSVDGVKYEFNFQVAPKESKTDTNAKEGFSVLFGYYPEAFDKATLDTIKPIAAKLEAYLKNKKSNITDLPQSVVDNMVNLLSRIQKSTDKKSMKVYVDFINQGLSHGKTFGEFFDKNPDFYIERGDFFDRIRKAGNKVSKVPADKWCPGDVYFIRNSSEDSIESILDIIENMSNNAPQSERAQNLSRLNSLFSPIFNGKVPAKTPIVAVSLKMADAQAGKLKSGLKDYQKNVKTDYNLSKDELSYKASQYRDGIVRLQKIIQSFINVENQSGNTIFKWDPKFDIDTYLSKNPKPNSSQMELIKFKYAAYKALVFIYDAIANKQPKEVDESLKTLVAFGLGLVSTKMEDVYINPPFFKVVANLDGSAMMDTASKIRPQFFKPGSVVTLAPSVGIKGKPIIHIKDTDQYKGLFMDMFLMVGEEKYDISVTFRSNGTSQLSIELQKAHLTTK